MSAPKDCVPRERLAAIIERVLPEYGGYAGENAEGMEARGVLADSGQCGPVEAMAHDIAAVSGGRPDTVSRRLSVIRSGKAGRSRTGESLPGNVKFETADMILSGLGLTHLWHTELADLYEQAA